MAVRAQADYRCSYCGKRGHNASTCERKPRVVNDYRRVAEKVLQSVQLTKFEVLWIRRRMDG